MFIHPSIHSYNGQNELGVSLYPIRSMGAWCQF